MRRALRDRLVGGHLSAIREVTAPGLVALVHVSLPDPRFDCRREHLRSPDARGAVRALVATGLYDELQRAPELRAHLLAHLPAPD